jgi:hypothetical protein
MRQMGSWQKAESRRHGPVSRKEWPDSLPLSLRWRNVRPALFAMKVRCDIFMPRLSCRINTCPFYRARMTKPP